MKIYLLDWKNGMVGIFRGDNFEQVSNTSKDMLLWSLKHLMGLYDTDSLEVSFLNSHDELNNKRREAGIGAKKNGRFYYVSISDVRYFSGEWHTNILYRTMAHDNDWTGGYNNYSTLERLGENLLRLDRFENK